MSCTTISTTIVDAAAAVGITVETAVVSVRKRYRGVRPSGRTRAQISADIAAVFASLYSDRPVFLESITRYKTVNGVRVPNYVLAQSGDAQTKLAKGEDVPYGIAGPQARLWVNLHTADIAHGFEIVQAIAGDWQYFGNVCANANGCVSSCIGETGRYGIGAKVARLWTRVLWHVARHLYLELLLCDIESIVRKARRGGYVASLRANVLSDIDVIGMIDPDYLASISDVLYPYDYTKDKNRKESAFYDLTYSVHAGWSVDDIENACKVEGKRVAVVVPTREDAAAMLAAGTWRGITIVDGDKSDERYKDPKGSIVVLYAKVPTRNRVEAIRSLFAGGMVRDRDMSITRDIPAGMVGSFAIAA